MKYKCMVILALLVSIQSLLFAQETIIFEDNFYDNSNNWSTRDDESVSLQVLNGKYSFEHKRSTGWWGTWRNIEINTYSDFSLSCNTLWMNGIENNSFELLWGLSDANNYFAFGVSANGYFIYRMEIEGTSKNLIEWTMSDYINKNGSNRITVKKIGSDYEFYINNNYVGKYKFDDFFGPKVGLGVNMNQKVLFDDLKVAYITNQNIITDNTGPEISIYEPSISMGSKIYEPNKQIFVKGKAYDNSGIYEVTVNGVEASINAYGEFQQNVKLAIGDNTVTVKATDTKNNVSTYTFYVNRQEPVNTVVAVDNTFTSTNEKRIALVIGNSNYGGGQSLKNPVKDAVLMSSTLKNLGFEVIERIDANKQSMEQAIREFSKKLPNYNVALFYYAGHGVQVDGLNYLIPTDAKLEDKSDCKFEAISVNYVVEEFEKYPDNVNIVILDACRNDPFRSWSRGAERGFKVISPTSGTIISFATSEGATASDGQGNNGLFTEQLVKQMYLPQSIESVFKKTRVEVERISNGGQSPQEWSKLKGDFYFKK